MKKHDILFLIVLLAVFPEIASAHTFPSLGIFAGIIILLIIAIYSIVQFIIGFWTFSDIHREFPGEPVTGYRILVYLSSAILLPIPMWGGFYSIIYFTDLPLFINGAIASIFLYFFPKLILKFIELTINTFKRALILLLLAFLLLFIWIIQFLFI